MPRLRDLDGQFVGQVDPQTHSFGYVDSIEEAQGVSFQCPKCAAASPYGPGSCAPDGVGYRGVHYVLCWFAQPRRAPRVPDSMKPGPGRWYFAGTGLDDLTFTGPGANSVQLLGEGCDWHGYVSNGRAD